MTRKAILYKTLPVAALALSLMAAPAHAGAFAGHGAALPPASAGCTTGEKPGEQGCYVDGLMTRPEAWLKDIIANNPKSIDQLTIYRDSPLAQVVQKGALINVKTSGTPTDTAALIDLATANNVKWSLRSSSYWDMGSSAGNAIAGALIGGLGLSAFFAGHKIWKERHQNKSKGEALYGEDGQVIINDKSKGKEKNKTKTAKQQTIIKWGAKVYEPESLTKVKISDVIGQEEAKVQIQEVLEFLRTPEHFREVEGRMPKGALFIGPPGVGKTLMAKAVAGESGIMVIVVSGAMFREMYVGVGAKRIKETFAVIDEALATYGKVILFVDEFDSLARKRGGPNSHGEDENTLNAFLAEMDGFEDRPGFFVMAATNLFETLDEAAVRPGRFDRKINFSNPGVEDRIKLIDYYLPERLRAPGLDLRALARGIPGASGAVINNGINEAKLYLARQRKLNRDLPPKLRQEDLDEGFATSIIGFRAIGKSYVLGSKDQQIVAYHEGGHALGYYYMTGKAPLRFTMVPRGQTGGHVMFDEDSELFRTIDNFKTHLVVALCGWAATYVHFDGHHDTTLSNDIKQLTQLSYQMVTQFGMSDELSFFSLAGVTDARLISEDRKARIEKEIDALIKWAKEKALKIVNGHHEELIAMADAVLAKETLLESDFKEIFMSGTRALTAQATVHIPAT